MLGRLKVDLPFSFALVWICWLDVFVLWWLCFACFSIVGGGWLGVLLFGLVVVGA